MDDKELKDAFKTGGTFEEAKGYLIVVCNDTGELEKKVSDKIKSGGYKLVGQPLVFKDQICQAITLANFGR